ncbi:hypothetical protein OH76DRAFT_794395 [Lentinus brumalis]|uniref:Uncharacterized protein n=1 Tax=Lentinus brumalis TaxID=2498619 RepID=A0A371D3H9_9APHY|nr:hypothetical protein OH76DRAFT_794395 [Polyporus brumalis]
MSAQASRATAHAGPQAPLRCTSSPSTVPFHQPCSFVHIFLMANVTLAAQDTPNLLLLRRPDRALLSSPYCLRCLTAGASIYHSAIRLPALILPDPSFFLLSRSCLPLRRALGGRMNHDLWPPRRAPTPRKPDLLARSCTSQRGARSGWRRCGAQTGASRAVLFP